MKFIREVEHHDGGPSLCSIRTDTYASSLAHFTRLADAARVDFPELAAQDIACVVYGGAWNKRIRGIEFRVPRSSVPATYIARRELEPHL